MLDEITRFHRDLRERGTIVSLSGTFSQGVNEEVCEALEFYVSKNGSEANLTSKLFAVFVEMAQNVRNYYARKQPYPEVYAELNNAGAIVIGKSGDCFSVSSVNMIETSDAAPLAARMEALRKLDREALKTVYRDRLRSSASSEGGAGLGLIDIARKADGRVEYRVEPRDERYSFFYLEATLGQKEGSAP